MQKKTPVRFRAARGRDAETLISMMRALNDEDPGPKPFDESRRRASLRGFIENDSFGQAWLIYAGRECAGYVVLTFGFSFEYRGRDAFIDEIYIAPAFRRRGIARRALEFVEAAAKKCGVRVLHLEVSHDNAAAYELYRGSGYVVHERYLMSKWFDAPGVRGREKRKTRSRLKSLEF